MIRPARADDLPALRDIERAAGQTFAAIGMTPVAEDEPPSLDDLRRYQRGGRAWVTADHSDNPVAYLIADLVDGNGHIEQVSVHPDHARQGIGRSLIEHLATWAAGRGSPALTLTTFTDVPWNAPYYERCGFRRLSDAELTPGLRRIRAREVALGLDRWPRVCMRRELQAG
ncbi:MAG: GNAT family N-acetyltransferase [Streptosporangiaceae bacterium]